MRRNWVFFLLWILCAIPVRAADLHPLLADVPENKDWHLANGCELTFIGDAQKTPAKIVFSKQKLRTGEIAIKLDTDGRECIFTSGGEKVSFSLLGKEPTFNVDLTGATPKILLNKVDDPVTRGRVIRVASAPTETIALELPKATYVTVTLENVAPPEKLAPLNIATTKPLAIPVVPAAVAAPENPPVTPAAPATVAPAPPAPPAAGDTLSQRMKRSVFKIELKNKAGKIYANGTGFLIDDKGRALTNFHVVNGAHSAVASSAMFENQSFKVELLQVFPDHDFALLHIDFGSPQMAAQFIPLVLSTLSAEPGTDVFAFGFPLGLGFSVNKGIVSGIRTNKDLPDKFRDKHKAADAHWVQTDCTINLGNSGGPLVDSRGNVIGINTWISLAANNAYFALSSTDVIPRLAKLPDKALTFVKALELYPPAKDDEPQWQAMPELPTIAIERNASPDQVAHAAHTLSQMFYQSCTKCGGDGQVVIKEAVGARGQGLTRTTYQERAVECSKCGGKGAYAGSPDAIYNAATNFTKTAASIRNNPQAMQTAFTKVRELVLAGSRKNPEGLLSLNDRAKAVLGLSNPVVKTPIAGVGQVLVTVPTPDGKNQIHIVNFLNSSRIVLLAEPLLSEATVNGFVFAGGINAGTISVPGAQDVMVLRNGYVMSIDILVNKENKASKKK